MKEDGTLQRLARYLMLRTSHQNNLGLLNGKIGVVIFFYHYSDYVNMNIYKKFAEELIDEVYNEMSDNCGCDFVNGLSGIAWGVEYLIRNNFVKADPNEVLIDLDKRILLTDVRRVEDVTLETGLKGLAYYVISRCANRDSFDEIISKNYIYDLICSLRNNSNKEEEINLIIDDLNSILNYEHININNYFLDKIIENTKYDINKLFETIRPLGIINNGISGVGLKLMKE